MNEPYRPTVRETDAAQLIDAWATALRGDWGTIDGRSCRAQLNLVTAALRGERELPSLEDIGVCVKDGGPHWWGEGWGHDCEDDDD